MREQDIYLFDRANRLWDSRTAHAIMQAQMFESRQVSRIMIRVEPDVQQKLAILGGEAADEVTDIPAAGGARPGTGQPIDFIYDAKREGGGTTRLFKLLQANSCRYACRYWSHLNV